MSHTCPMLHSTLTLPPPHPTAYSSSLTVYFLLHSTFCTSNFTLYILHSPCSTSTLHSSRSTLQTPVSTSPHSTLQSPHSTPHSPLPTLLQTPCSPLHARLQTLHSPLHAPRSPLSTFAIPTPRSTLPTPHFNYTSHFTVYAVYTPPSTLQSRSTLHTPQSPHDFTASIPHLFPLHTSQSTPHALRLTLHSLHSALSAPHSTSPRSTLHTPTLYARHSITTPHAPLHCSHSPRSTPHSPHFTLPTPHSTLHPALSTLHSALSTPHSTLHTPHPPLHTPHSPRPTLHSVHFTLQTPHFPLHTPIQVSQAILKSAEPATAPPTDNLQLGQRSLCAILHWISLQSCRLTSRK